jgi:hypothetical protein
VAIADWLLSEHNVYARHWNGKLNSSWGQQYIALKSINNQPIPNFPKTSHDVDRLDGAHDIVDAMMDARSY